MTGMLDERSKMLMKALVERYIADGQPVGSRTLSKESGLDLSPATIRNVMSDLEDLGLIVSPHTSAGRIPTARGYRLFVDTMLTVQQGHMATHSLAPDQPQRVISNAANLLSDMFEDLEDHQHKEEAVLFPAMIRGMGQVLRDPIARMMQDHDDLGALLAFMAELTDDFVAPEGACATWRALYAGCSKLDMDLREHVHLENNILFQRCL